MPIGRQLIVTFHGVGTPSRLVEGTERSVWIQEAQFGEFFDAAVSRDDIRLTFDDGNASDVEIALPALLKRGLRAEFFITAGRLGERGFLTAEQVRELAASGMDVGSHGLEHRPWRRLTHDQLRDALVRSRQVLEEVSGREITTVSVPYGDYGRAALRALRTAGYTRVYTSDGGWARPSAWLQPRNTVHTDESLADMLEAANSPMARGIRALKRPIKRWR